MFYFKRVKKEIQTYENPDGMRAVRVRHSR